MLKLLKAEREIPVKLLTSISLAFLYIPLIIFLLTWTKPVIGIIASAGCIVGVVIYIRSEDNSTLKFHPSVLLLFIIIASAMYLYFGAAGIFRSHQHYDWFKHNTVLSDMIDNSWPVVYENEGVSAMLCYYLGIYMVPSLIGRAAGFMPALASLYIQSLLVLVIAYMVFLKELQDSGRFRGTLLKRELSLTAALLIFSLPFERTVHVDMIGFPGGMYIYLAAALSLRASKDLKKIALWAVIWLPVSFYAILAIAGGVIFMILHLAIRIREERQKTGKKATGALRRLMTNIPVAISVMPTTVVMIIYYAGNIFSDKEGLMKLTLGLDSPTQTESIAEWLISFFVTLVILSPIYVCSRRSKRCIAAILVIVACAFITSGVYNDTQLSVINVAAAFLVPYTTYYFSSYTDLIPFRRMSIVKATAMMVSLALMLSTVLSLDYHELIAPGSVKEGESHTIMVEFGDREYPQTLWCINEYPRIYSYGTMGYFTYGKGFAEASPDLRYNYFSYDSSRSLFRRYIASN